MCQAFTSSRNEAGRGRGFKGIYHNYLRRCGRFLDIGCVDTL